MTTPDIGRLLAASIDVAALKANLPSPAEFERLLRDYARIREMCGLGQVIDGQVVAPRPELEGS